MAIIKLNKDGYGQIEINNCAFRRDGRIEAQCKLDPVEFKVGGEKAENGMLLGVDNVSRTCHKATAKDVLVGIHYSTERVYEFGDIGLKKFALEQGSFLPRIGFLAIADKFTTNTVCFDEANFADEEALDEAFAGLAEAPLYATIASDGCGYWEIVKEKPEGICAVVTKKTTMPDGQKAVQLQIVKA